jgi:hypothetical protein
MRPVVWVGLGILLAVPCQHLYAADSAPTYTKDVAPILFAKCASCHRPGEVAPMSLLTYNEVRPWAKAIRGKVMAREMPPWGADPRYGTFSNDRSLTQRELQTIVAWVEAGLPKGNDADMPSPPVLTNGWEHGQPDAVIEMLAPFHLPAEGQMPGNMNFYAPVPFKEDRFGRLVEFRMGNRSVVHHCNASVGDLPEGSKLDEVGQLVLPDGTLENDVTRPSRQNAQQRNAFTQLLDCVPGRSAFPVPSPEIGFRIGAGKYIRFGLHYQTSGQPETDQSKVGLWFTDRKVVQELHREGIGHALVTATDKKGFYFVEGKSEIHDPRSGVRWEAGWPPVPAFGEGYRVMGVTPVVEAITLYGFTPHMHLRGTDMTWYLTYPDGRQETLLSIPKYDFSWQLYYELKEPLHVPAGSTISNVAHYSNAASNRFNPAPDKPVYWSEQSWDEMFLPFIAYTIDSQNLPKDQTQTTGDKGQSQSRQ